jgi:non-homologous end joining protein Ku
MGRAFGSSVIGIGSFVQVPVNMYKATKTEGVRGKLHTVCSCGGKPKQNIACEKCGAKYTSWSAIPDREFDSGGDQRIKLTKEEIDNAKSASNHDMMQVEKVVNLAKFATRYILSEPIFLLPDEEAPGAQKKAYRTIVEALASEGKVMLTRFTMRGYSKRFAIAGDKERNVLVAYEVDDAQAVSADIPKDPVDPKTLKDAKTLLATAETEDVEFSGEPDPLEEIISNKIDEQMRKGGLS